MTESYRNHYDRIAAESILFCATLRNKPAGSLTPEESRLLKVVDEYATFVEVPIGPVRVSLRRRIKTA